MATQERCRLCLISDKLRNSHILPEFLYAGSDVYDAQHRTVSIDPQPDQKDRVLQKGLRETLLCGTCEGRLANLERYAAEMLTQN